MDSRIHLLVSVLHWSVSSSLWLNVSKEVGQRIPQGSNQLGLIFGLPNTRNKLPYSVYTIWGTRLSFLLFYLLDLLPRLSGIDREVHVSVSNVFSNLYAHSLFGLPQVEKPPLPLRDFYLISLLMSWDLSERGNFTHLKYYTFNMRSFRQIKFFIYWFFF